MKNAIVFDLDGTLYDSKELDEENRNAAIAAIVEFKSVSWLAGEHELNEARNQIGGTTSISRALFSLGVPDGIFKKHQLQILAPERHIKEDLLLVELMRSLKNKYKIALYTNTRRELVSRIISSIGFNFDEFDLIVAGGDVLEPKPSVFELDKIIKSMSVEVENCYAVGDRWLVDLAPAESLGMKTVQVSSRKDLISWLQTLQ